MRRLRFFLYSLLLLPIMVLMALLGTAGIFNARFPIAAAILVSVLIGVFVTWASFALGAKRCHDLDKSAWLYFWIVIVPGLISTTVSIDLPGRHFAFEIPVLGGVAGLVSFLGFLYVLFARGTDGPNTYGYPPEAS